MYWRRKIGARVSFDMGEEFAAMPEPAIIFPDRLYSEEWRVEWVDDDGACEVAIFAGPNARERAIRYADRQYGLFEEVSFDP
jgi:hypothetical protein